MLGGLDLELLPHVVLDAHARACNRVAPHLEHPTKGSVGGPVGLEVDRELVPERRQLLEVVYMHDRGRRTHWLHRQMVAVVVALDHGGLLRGHWRHIREEEGDVELGRRAVGNVVQK